MRVLKSLFSLFLSSQTDFLFVILNFVTLFFGFMLSTLNISVKIWLCRVDLELPKIEVRFQNLKVEAFVHVGSRALPTIPNFVFNMTEVEFLHSNSQLISLNATCSIT